MVRNPLRFQNGSRAGVGTQKVELHDRTSAELKRVLERSCEASPGK